MKAIQYLGPKHVELRDVPRPALKPGHAVVKVQAAGVCQTDVHMRASEQQMLPTGLVLGHEIAGVIAEVADGATGLEVGDSVVVHPVWSCGVCRQCAAGRENACLNTSARMAPAPTPGVSVDGGLAEYIVVPESALVPADGLDPVYAAALTDAGLVPYHSIQATRDLLRPGSSAVVIGIGGLGQYAVRLLAQLTGVKIIALDVKQEALDAIRDSVDHVFRSDDPDVTTQVLRAAGGYGADVVLDLVGNSATLALDGAIVAPYGAIRVPGLSDGVFEFETSQLAMSLPWGASLTRPYSGTHQDLRDLVELARVRDIGIQVTKYEFADALRAFDDLEAGRITGRAIVVLDDAIR